ncbi:MAG: ABC transporter permease [Aestuariivirga sp.]|nr:ABC transporter permease [Aestuariivirga sp.]
MLWEAIKLANQSVRRNVLRSILTLLGIVIGVSAVIAMVTIGNGTTQKVTEDLSKLGSNMLVARPGRETFGGGGDVRSFTERNVATLRSELADVRAIAPAATRAARVVYGAENYDTTVTGTESDFFLVQDWSFESGRPFTDGDIRSASSVCVIGQTVKTVLFGQADPLGLRLRLGGVSCEVIGVLNGKGQSAFGSDQDNTVLMPLRTFQRRIAGNQRISTIYIAAASTDSIPTVQAAAEDILREQRRVAPYEESDFSVRDMTQMVSTLTSTTTAMTGLLSAVAAVSLLVGGIGIMNIMLVSVTERTREIGIRLAIGALEKQVLTQFLVESVVLAVFGGLVGIILGLAIAGWATYVMVVPFTVNPSIVALAFVFSGLIGVVFGYFPARRAARLDPIEALRHE